MRESGGRGGGGYLDGYSEHGVDDEEDEDELGERGGHHHVPIAHGRHCHYDKPEGVQHRELPTQVRGPLQILYYACTAQHNTQG